MAKRTRPKKSIRKTSRRVRSVAAVKGWKTRRKNFAKRSRAAKKGARTKRARLYLKRERDKKQKPGKQPAAPRREPKSEPPLRDFVISLSYKGRKGNSRTVDFVASARTREEALEQLFEEKPWTEKIPWQKVSIHAGPVVKESHELLSRLETKSSSRRKRTKSK